LPAEVFTLYLKGETRCLEERLLALKTSNESGIPVFVPVCREDGTYVDVQCHYGTGYCWCVNQVSMLPNFFFFIVDASDE
jgi:hypothetical protein